MCYPFKSITKSEGKYRPYVLRSQRTATTEEKKLRDFQQHQKIQTEWQCDGGKSFCVKAEKM